MGVPQVLYACLVSWYQAFFSEKISQRLNGFEGGDVEQPDNSNKVKVSHNVVDSVFAVFRCWLFFIINHHN